MYELWFLFMTQRQRQLKELRRKTLHYQFPPTDIKRHIQWECSCPGGVTFFSHCCLCWGCLLIPGKTNRFTLICGSCAQTEEPIGLIQQKGQSVTHCCYCCFSCPFTLAVSFIHTDFPINFQGHNCKDSMTFYNTDTILMLKNALLLNSHLMYCTDIRLTR